MSLSLVFVVVGLCMVSDERINVVLIEDESAHISLLERALEEDTDVVWVARLRDGDTALRYLQGAVETPADLILVDIRLPRRDGLEVVRFIRQTPAYNGAAVVVLTTSIREQDIQAAYSIGADGYIIKPFDIHAIRDLLLKLGRCEDNRAAGCCCTDSRFKALQIVYCPASHCVNKAAIMN